MVGGLDGDVAASETRSFFTTMAPLPPPPAPVAGCAVALDSPADGATIDAAPTFVWATDCTGAYLELSTDVSFPVEASYYFSAVSNGRYTIGETLWASLAPRFAVDGGYWRVTAGATEGPAVFEVRAFNRPPVGEGEEPLGPIAWTGLSGQAGAEFGHSVASAGDVNGDGYDDVVVGVPYWDGFYTDEGAAFLFLGSPTGLAASPSWVADGSQTDAHFGMSVASAGDVDGDGYDDVIVGAHRYSAPETWEGSAFLYSGSPSGLASLPSWSIEGGATYTYLGTSAASAGDVNGDGFGDVVVGASLWSNGQPNEGKALVYLGSATGLSDSPQWGEESDNADAGFGVSVARAGDVNGDGYSDVVIGAWMWSGGEAVEGAAFLYPGSASGLGAPGWSVESNQANAYFGRSVASAGDVNGDGYADVVVGAPGYPGLSGQGAAFLYLGSAAGLGESSSWSAEADQAGPDLGQSVAGAGDVGGDGFDDVIVGAPLWDGGEVDEGAAFLFLGMGGPDPVEGDTDGDGFAPPDDCDDADPAVYPGAEEVCDDADPAAYPGAEEVCDGIDQDCDDVVDNGLDADFDGWTPCAGDCDDGDPAVHPEAEDLCDGVDTDCDGDEDDHPGTAAECPAASCLDALLAWGDAPDALYWVDPLETGAEQVHCDMAGGGWTLVYRATNDGLVAENGVVGGPAAIGAVPITPTSTGNNKLDDSVINALRSGAVENDLKVVVFADGAVLGPSYHRSACTLQSGTWLNATDVCNQSTTSGPDATDWVQSGHAGSLTRWYVDGAVGYIWPYTHVGPISTGWAHGGSLPNPYCTWYDYRVCNQSTYFEIWAY